MSNQFYSEEEYTFRDFQYNTITNNGRDVRIAGFFDGNKKVSVMISRTEFARIALEMSLEK